MRLCDEESRSLDDVRITHRRATLWQATLPGSRDVVLEVATLGVEVVLSFEREHG